MYALKPIFDLDAAVEVPSCMYPLPVIQQSQRIGSELPQGALEALSARQEAILARLGQLKEEVDAYKKSLGLPVFPPTAPSPAQGSASSIERQLKRLRETISRVQLLFSSHTKPVKESQDKILGCVPGGTVDCVVQCPPSLPLHSLPLLCSLLIKAGVSLHTSTHIHSSVTTKLPPHLSKLLPTSNIERRSASLRLTLIWSLAQPVPQLVVSPLLSNNIQGEANILRFLARAFPQALPYESVGKGLAQIDRALDLATTLHRLSPKERSAIIKSLTVSLDKGGYLVGESLTIADLALASVIKGLGLEKELSSGAQKWLKSTSASQPISHSSSNSGNPGKSKEKSSTQKKTGKENQPPLSNDIADSSGKLGKDGLFQYFNKTGIIYKNVDHPEVFTVDAMIPYLSNVEGAICKNLFLKDKKKNFYLLSARHDREVNLTEVGKKIGVKDLRFGDESVMFDLIGVKQGCVTSFALVNDQATQAVKFVCDSALLEESTKFVNFHPMVNTATTQISVTDFKKFLTSVGHHPLLF